MRATDIVAYTYQAEHYTPQGIVAALTTNPGQVGPVVVAPESVEAHLNVLSYIAGIDRTDETSFDSDDFPKVVFAYQMALDETVVDADGRHILYSDTL